MISGLFSRRVRGVRLVNLWGAGVLLVLVVGLYLTKTFAGGERADIARAEADIADEQHRIRVLQAEVAYLEQPQRIDALSRRYLGLEPTPGKREAAPAQLRELAARTGPVEVKPTAPYMAVAIPVPGPSPAPAPVSAGAPQ